MQTTTVDNRISPGYIKFFKAWLRHNPGKMPPSETSFLEFVDLSERRTSPCRSSTPTELMEVFPEALAVVKIKNKEWQDELAGLDEKFKPVLDNIRKRYTGIVQDLHIDLQEIIYNDEETKLKNNIKRTNHFLCIDEWKRKPPSEDQITDREIALAKTISIKDISGLRYSHAGFTQCPFHNEKTPSFRVYADNRFHCFGCQENGDVIDFVMQMHDLGFLDAVKFLIKR